ncbi:MAG: 16S rRNA (cytosine(967)-C(5))-methyltransferase RsmB [Proteobacteria bacterium]|nr:16S rRNA (cytosine(967)-C(5))-methyltransferase RsmB [Pseudomonadota bacterium]
MVQARDVALNVLTRVEKGKAFAAAVLGSELESVKNSQEAGLATELVLGVLRRQPFLDQLLESASDRGLKKLDPKTRQILRLGAYQIAFLDGIPARAAVSEAVCQARNHGRPGLAGFVNALLRSISKAPKKSLMPNENDMGGPIEEAAIHLGLPTWLLERLVVSRGRQEAFEIARAFNKPSKRTLRVNVNRMSRVQFLKELASDGAVGRLTPWSVEVMNPRSAARLVENGLAVYQDEGAQLVALALDPRPGDRILDACAGRGGKTSALAMITDGTAHILAADRNPSKLERLDFELNRQGFQVATAAADLTVDSKNVGDGFSKILLDAPCSGTGTLGRRPELRWRLDSKAIESLVDIQSRLLDSTAQLLAPGGLLVYAVCSVLPEEGLDQAASFLKSHSGFCPACDPPASWPQDIPWMGGVSLVNPAQTRTDGYQIISLKKM